MTDAANDLPVFLMTIEGDDMDKPVDYDAAARTIQRFFKRCLERKDVAEEAAIRLVCCKTSSCRFSRLEAVLVLLRGFAKKKIQQIRV